MSEQEAYVLDLPLSEVNRLLDKLSMLDPKTPKTYANDKIVVKLGQNEEKLLAIDEVEGKVVSIPLTAETFEILVHAVLHSILRRFEITKDTLEHLEELQKKIPARIRANINFKDLEELRRILKEHFEDRKMYTAVAMLLAWMEWYHAYSNDPNVIKLWTALLRQNEGGGELSI